jgi:hypothetical protein
MSRNTLGTHRELLQTSWEPFVNVMGTPKFQKKPKLLRNQLSNQSQNKLELALA